MSQWTCSICTYVNIGARSICELCQSPKPAAAAPSIPPTPVAPTQPITPNHQNATEFWSCSKCTLTNKADRTVCDTCRTPRPQVPQNLPDWVKKDANTTDKDGSPKSNPPNKEVNKTDKKKKKTKKQKAKEARDKEDARERQQQLVALKVEAEKAQKEQAKAALATKKEYSKQLANKKTEEQRLKKLELIKKEREQERVVEEEKQKRREIRREKENRIPDIPSAINHIRDNYGPARLQLTCNLIRKIISKIIKYPDENKYRSIKLEKETVQRALVRPLGAMVMLRIIGFKEVGEHSIIMDASAVNINKLKQHLAIFEKVMTATKSIVPEKFSSINSKCNTETVYFGAIAVRDILHNVMSLPNEPNFCSVDMSSETYKYRLAPIPQLIQLLEYFGFQDPKKGKEGAGLYLKITEPDLNLMEAGVIDLCSEITTRGHSTPIFKETKSLIKNNSTRVVAKLVEKLQVCLHRIITQPHETKYQKINLAKFFNKLGSPVAGGYEYFQLFGFKVDGIEQKAQMPYPFDTNLLQLRYNDLERVWKGVLIDLKKKRALKKANSKSATTTTTKTTTFSTT